jgi:hypothetical protein
MQLKLDRTEKETKGFFGGTKVDYVLRAALTVSPEEEAKMKQLGFWKRRIKELTREEEKDYDLFQFSHHTFQELVKGFSAVGSLSYVEARERDILNACKMVKHHLEGGQAGERIIDL